MQKLTLATAISAIVSSSAIAVPINYHTGAASGTVSDPFASFVSTAAGPVDIKYVDWASGSASNKSTPAIQLTGATSWIFDFTNPAAVAFTGLLYLGDHRVQTALTYPLVDGRQTFVGATQSFSGVGAYNEATNTFTYNVLNPVNSGGASVFSATSSTCMNGATNFLGKVCQYYSTTTPAWEGLALNFVFEEDRSSFTGSIQGRNTSGSGISALSTLINWHVTAVPVPTAAWLFGSALAALAGTRARRRSSGR